MSAHASIRNGYRARLLVVFAAFLGMGSWFLYDAAIGYPYKQQMQQTYQRLQEEHPRTWQRHWQETVQANGWPSEPPADPVNDQDIIVQWVIACALLPLGLIAGVVWLRMGSRWISTDEQGLHTSWGQHAPWDSIDHVDKSRWQKKGIAVVHYKDNGTSRRITLDDWKYDREPTGQMLGEVEAQLSGKGPDATDEDADAQAAPANSSG